MTDQSPSPARFEQLLDAWSRSLTAHAPATWRTKSALVPHLAAASDHLLDDARVSLGLSGVPVTLDLIRARAAVVCPPDPGDPWPSPDPVARIKAPAPCDFLPGEIDPVTLAAVDGFLACQRKFKATVLRLLQGDAPAAVLRDDLARWATALLEPWARAGFMPAQDTGRLRTRATCRTELSRALPAPDDIPACLDLALGHPDLVRHPLLVHLAVLWILPWPAGNGRLARLAHSALALGAGRSWPIPAGTDRTAYQAAARTAFTDGDPLPLMPFSGQ